MLGQSPRFSQGAYRVEPMLTADSVIYAIRSQRRAPNPDYVKAVLRSYVDVKLARGKTKGEADYKFTLLERELSEYGGIFRAVREETGLRPPLTPRIDTSLRRAVSSQPTSSLTPGQTRIPGINRTNTAAPSTSTSRRASSAVHSTPVNTTLRPTEEDGELPPPPYARQDPEPDSTRLLQDRLAAEEAAGGGVPVGLERPSTPPVTVYATPPGPPPQSITSTRPRVNSEMSNRPPISNSPPHTPTDPDVARVWEESQLEEAKRASRAAERERLELEEAIRQSMEEAEASGIGLDDPPGGGGGPGGMQSEDLGGGSFGSYNPGSTSGTGGQAYGGVSGLEAGIQGMNMGEGMPGGRSREHELMSLMDDDGGMAGGNVLVPERTGTVLKSNNPFLSPAEREETNASGGPSQQTRQSLASQNSIPGYSTTTPPTPNIGHSGIGMGSPQTSLLPAQTPASRQPSNTSLRDAPGSSYTTFSPPPASSPSARPLPQTPRQDGQNQYGSPLSQIRASPQTPGGARPPQTPNSAPRLPSRSGGPISNTGGFGWDQNPSFAIQEKGSQRLSMSGPYPTFSPSPPHTPGRERIDAAGPSRSPSGPNRQSTRDVVKKTGEDPLEMLREFDTVFLVDDSASMIGERWESAKNALMGVAEVAAGYDEDGIDIYFLNSKRVGRELRNAADVEELFAGLIPRGATPTGVRLDLLLREYLGRLERSGLASPTSEVPGEMRDTIKPMNLIVVTDGVFARPALLRRGISSNVRPGMLVTAPTDDPQSVIINAAKRLDRGGYPLSQLGIQFLQIGDDVEAREALQELDDGLSAAHDVRDIVDTVLYNGEAMTSGLIIKTLLGGINRRLDRRGHAG